MFTLFWNKKFKVDVRGVDKEHMSKEGSPEEKLKRAEGLSTTPNSGCFLFVTHTDHDITKVVDNFRRKRSVEAIGKRWSYIRTSIVKVKGIPHFLFILFISV